MLESLKLSNFQAHRKLLVKFDPGVTTIVGRTDAGKSSILRCLRWVFLNRAPSDYITHGQEFASARLKIDGRTVIRRKDKRANTYRLDDKKYSAVRSEVPESVSKLLKVNNNNFQRQLEGPFWFDKSPGQVSKALNQIVNLGIIDDTISEVSNRVRYTKTQVEVCRERLAEARKQKRELSWVPAMLAAYDRLQRLSASVDSKADRVERQRLLLARATKLLKRQRNARREAVAIARLGKLADRLLAPAKQQERLAVLISKLERAEKQSWRTKKELKRKQSELKSVKGVVCPKCGQKMPTS